MIPTVLLVAALAAAPPSAPEPASSTLTLSDALRRALRSNLALRRAQEEVAAAEAQKKAALSLIFPKLGVTGSLVRNTDEVSFGSGSDTRTILPESDWNYRVTLNQPVFAGLREKRAYDQAKVGIENARDVVAGAEDLAMLQVAADYLRAVQGQALLEVEERTRVLAERRKENAQNLFEAGEVTRVDVLRAEAAIKGAERRVVGARQDRDEALGRLRVSLALDGDLAVVEPGAPLAAVPTEAELLAVAEQRRSEVQQARNALRIAELEVAKQRGAYLPVVTADAGYVRQKTTFPKDEYGFAALRFTVPIFQGGEIGARVALARARQRQAELQLEEQRRRVREDVHTAVLGMTAATTSLALAEEQLAASEAEYAQTFERYQGQEATSLDLEAAELTLAESRRAVATARLEVRVAELKAWAAGGVLKDAVQKESGE